MRKEARIKKELLKITAEQTPDPEDVWLHEHFPDLKKESVTCIDVTSNQFQPSSDVLCYAQACKVGDCPARERVMSLCGEFFNADVREANGEVNHFEEIVYSMDAALTAEDILKRVVNDTSCMPSSFEYVARNNSNYGFEILGVQESSLDEEKCFDGRIILSVDMSIDLEILKDELCSLKNITFKQAPTFEMLCQEFEHGYKNYLLEKRVIENTQGVAFSPSDMRSRAVGLWLYESIIDLEIFKTVTEAYDALECGKWTLRAIKNGVPETGNLEKPLDKLGYSRSGISLFQRLYRNTRRCIEANEVLSLAS